MVKVLVSLVSTTPSGLIGSYMCVLGSLNTGVWNYWVQLTVSQDTLRKEGLLIHVGVNVLVQIF